MVRLRKHKTLRVSYALTPIDWGPFLFMMHKLGLGKLAGVFSFFLFLGGPEFEYMFLSLIADSEKDFQFSYLF